ncbi:GNAT family N-acetyltransferase, partial [Pseudonocardia sp. KRD291]|uniref:GNAT family N-acetyltransferase n=1 Tax=Pseudonocardia sp. KRD291 TaxID=2792007 RepID=UPI001C4A6FE6|nr:GNAT family N-acetyltransferase [Pseudonocardia sp. KRD291]
MTVDTRTATLRRSWALDLDAPDLYALLRLRVEVFVVEQDCPYPELDGRDLEPRTRHYWLTGPPVEEGPAPVLGTLRLLKEPDGGYRIGRVCTRGDARGRGLGAQLMSAALAEVGSGTCVLDAQEQQVPFYERFGFTATGPSFLEDGIAHVPM